MNEFLTLLFHTKKTKKKKSQATLKSFLKNINIYFSNGESLIMPFDIVCY